MKLNYRAYWANIKKHRKINSTDITFFLRQFAILIIAGIPILKCLSLLEQSQNKIAMRLLLFSIRRELLSGKEVYASLHVHKKYFDELTCQLIKIGEHTGKLDITLNMIADEHEKRLAFVKRIQQALFYPCLITIAATLVTISLFLFVIPRFAELFADSHVALPALTRLLFFLSAQLNQHMYYLLLFAIPLLIFSLQKKSLLLTLRKLPVIRTISQKILLARFAKHLAITFAAGIPIIDALKLLAHSPSHPEFAQAIFHLRSKINAGFYLHQAMQTSSLFPDLMIQMVKTGEESGALDQLLFKLAGFFEADIDQMLNQFNRLLEPLIMLVLGVLIGGLIIGMYLPIFKLGMTL
jgi:type IV pilus assembly protein PilC